MKVCIITIFVSIENSCMYLLIEKRMNMKQIKSCTPWSERWMKIFTTFSRASPQIGGKIARAWGAGVLVGDFYRKQYAFHQYYYFFSREHCKHIKRITCRRMFNGNEYVWSLGIHDVITIYNDTGHTSLSLSLFLSLSLSLSLSDVARKFVAVYGQLCEEIVLWEAIMWMGVGLQIDESGSWVGRRGTDIGQRSRDKAVSM